MGTPEKSAGEPQIRVILGEDQQLAENIGRIIDEKGCFWEICNPNATDCLVKLHNEFVVVGNAIALLAHTNGNTRQMAENCETVRLPHGAFDRAGNKIHAEAGADEDEDARERTLRNLILTRQQIANEICHTMEHADQYA